MANETEGNKGDYLPEEIEKLRQVYLPNLVEAEFGWVQKRMNADGEVEVTIATHIKNPKEPLIELIKQREIKRKYWEKPNKANAQKLLEKETERYQDGDYRSILPAAVSDILHYITCLKVENDEISPYLHSDPTHTIKFKDKTSPETKCLIKFVPYASNPQHLEQIYSEGDLYFIGHNFQEEEAEEIYQRQEENRKLKELETEKKRIESEIRAKLANKEEIIMGRKEREELEREKKNLEKKIREASKEIEEKKREILADIKAEDKSYIFNFGLILQGQADEYVFNAFKNSLLKQLQSRSEVFFDRKRYAKSPDSTKVRVQCIYRIENPKRIFVDKEIIPDMVNEQLILTPYMNKDKLNLDYQDAYVEGEEGFREQLKARGKRKFYNLGVECVNNQRLDYEVLGGEILTPIIAWNKIKNEFFYIALVPWYSTLKDESMDWDWIDKILEGKSLRAYVSSLGIRKKSNAIENFLRNIFCIKEESKEGLYLGSQIFTVKSASEDSIEKVFNNGKYSLLSSQQTIFRAAR